MNLVTETRNTQRRSVFSRVLVGGLGTRIPDDLDERIAHQAHSSVLVVQEVS